MIGAIIGDIIGSQFEMFNYTSKNMMFKDYDFIFFTDKCRPTDDTVLTIAVLDCVLNKKSYPETFKEYAKKYPTAGYGGSFINWVDSEGFEPYNSYGNGSAMRVSPIGWLFDTLEEVLVEAEKSASATHNHPEGIKGAQATALCVLMARQKQSKDLIKSTIIDRFSYDLNRTLDEIRPTYEFSATCQVTVPESIIAFLESENYIDCIRKGISIGGDSDTIACISGGIAEAYYGMETIPEDVFNNAMSILNSYSPDLYSTLQNSLPNIYKT